MTNRYCAVGLLLILLFPLPSFGAGFTLTCRIVAGDKSIDKNVYVDTAASKINGQSATIDDGNLRWTEPVDDKSYEYNVNRYTGAVLVVAHDPRNKLFPTFNFSGQCALATERKF